MVSNWTACSTSGRDGVLTDKTAYVYSVLGLYFPAYLVVTNCDDHESAIVQ